MPRKPRFILPGVPVHVVQRGHNHEPVFFDTPDYQTYLHWLKEASERYHCDIHAYVLMTNHVHLLVTPQHKNSVSLMMQYVGRHYVPYIHHTYGTSGTIWEGRYKASLIQDEQYLLTCMRYIEQNPVRASMVKSPGAYRWSSYSANGLGKHNDLIHKHALYKALARTTPVRIQVYRDMFKAQVDDSILSDIRASWQTGTPLGNDHFKKKIEAKLQCKVGQARRGRPLKGL